VVDVDVVVVVVDVLVDVLVVVDVGAPVVDDELAGAGAGAGGGGAPKIVLVVETVDVATFLTDIVEGPLAAGPSPSAMPRVPSPTSAARAAPPTYGRVLPVRRTGVSLSNRSLSCRGAALIVITFRPGRRWRLTHFGGRHVATALTPIGWPRV
jgi:hypothetical protein